MKPNFMPSSGHSLPRRNRPSRSWLEHWTSAHTSPSDRRKRQDGKWSRQIVRLCTAEGYGNDWYNDPKVIADVFCDPRYKGQ